MNFSSSLDADKLNKFVKSNSIFLWKGVFKNHEVDSVIDELFYWRDLNEQSHCSLNSHRLIENQVSKKIDTKNLDYEEGKTKIKVYNYKIGDIESPYFYKNKMSNLQRYVRKKLKLYRKVTNQMLFDQQSHNGRNLYIEFGHYVDGYIERHTHCAHYYYGQKFAMIVMLSEYKKDFYGGDLVIFEERRTKNEERIVLNCNKGDAIFFPMTVPHEVTKVVTPQGQIGRFVSTIFYY